MWFDDSHPAIREQGSKVTKPASPLIRPVACKADRRRSPSADRRIVSLIDANREQLGDRAHLRCGAGGPIHPLCRPKTGAGLPRLPMPQERACTRFPAAPLQPIPPAWDRLETHRDPKNAGASQVWAAMGRTCLGALWNADFCTGRSVSLVIRPNHSPGVGVLTDGRRVHFCRSCPLLRRGATVCGSARGGGWGVGER